ncbi:MAG: acyl-CoA reductase [Saprospiraceae bacterium]|nr:acyl-CoA reductase [Saprospiraceae bacterium]
MSSSASFLSSLPALRGLLTHPSQSLEDIIQKAFAANPWFIPEFTKAAIDSIATEFLDENACAQWISSYPQSSDTQKTIAVIMAGNLPLVGFHDLLCILASGHKALIKLSDKDSVLLPWLTDQWITIEPSLAPSIKYVYRLDGFDAAIATGSNNSARYFDYYFRSYPHVLRQNRNGIAVLTGEESLEELRQLAKDIFLFFGLGCRNVSRIYVPSGYDFSGWEEAMAEWKYLGDHNKYRNNLDYNFAIYIINSVPHINLGHLILKEDDAIASRIGCVHYSYYDDLNSLEDLLQTKKDEIQCIVSKDPIQGWDHVRFGESQQPRLDQYADGIDTMQFLTSL